MTVEALTDREGKQANTAMEEEEMLRPESLPPNDDDQWYELPPVGSSHTRATEQAVVRTHFRPSVRKALGPDELSFGAIRLLWRKDEQRMWGWQRQPFAREDTQEYGSGPAGWWFASLAKMTIWRWRRIAPYPCWATLERWPKKWSWSFGQKRPKEEGDWATDNSGAGWRSQPSTQRVSWLAELM